MSCLLHAGTINYSYNSAGRLTAVSYENGKVQTFSYDNAGNLTQNATTIPGPSADTDGDGIADAWEQQYFGNLDRTGTGDFDGDGMIDFNEFLAGTDPTSAASSLKIVPPPLLSGGVTIRWESISGKVYRLQYKDDLSAATWWDVSGNITASGNISSKTDTNAPILGRRYYRVVLVP